jgi:hypothetical protein
VLPKGNLKFFLGANGHCSPAGRGRGGAAA